MSFIAIKSKKKVEAPLPDFDLEIPADEVRISDAAAERIRSLKTEDATLDYLRVGITGGGCSGLSYSYAPEHNLRAGDLVFKNGNSAICVDPKSLKVIGGSLLHWHDAMKRSGFELLSKRGRKSCSCGESFSL